MTRVWGKSDRFWLMKRWAHETHLAKSKPAIEVHIDDGAGDEALLRLVVANTDGCRLHTTVLTTNNRETMANPIWTMTAVSDNRFTCK